MKAAYQTRSQYHIVIIPKYRRKGEEKPVPRLSVPELSFRFFDFETGKISAGDIPGRFPKCLYSLFSPFKPADFYHQSVKNCSDRPAPFLWRAFR